MPPSRPTSALERTSARRAGRLSCTSIERVEAAQLFTLDGLSKRDYTKVPVGTVLPNGETVSKCPICGRPGIVSETESYISTKHTPTEVWITANGEERGKQPIPRGSCHRSKKRPA
jgi:hypothetical protein